MTWGGRSPTAVYARTGSVAIECTVQFGRETLFKMAGVVRVATWGERNQSVILTE